MGQVDRGLDKSEHRQRNSHPKSKSITHNALFFFWFSSPDLAVLLLLELGGKESFILPTFGLFDFPHRARYPAAQANQWLFPTHPCLNARGLYYSAVPKTVELWKAGLTSKSGSSKIADTIATPAENPELFAEGWEEALEREAVAAGLTEPSRSVSTAGGGGASAGSEPAALVVPPANA
jgi:hypothetical protein